MSDQYDLEQFASADSGDERRSEEEEPTESSPEDHGTARFPSLPTDWEIKRLDEVATVQGGSTPSTDEDEYWGGDILWATPTDLTGLQGNTISDTEDTITEDGLASSSTHVLPPYSVLLTSRASIGKCAVNTVPMATNQGFQSLIPGEEVNTWYLYYVITEMAPYLESLGAGSTFSEISKREVQRVQIPVPPMEEQLRIASVLQNLDSTLELVKEEKQKLHRVQRGVKQTVYHQGINEDGELTNTPVGEIPAHWDLVTIGDVTEMVQYGTSDSLSEEGEYPVFRMNNIENGYMVPSPLKYGEFDEETVEKYELKKGDILFNRTNSPELVGKTGIFELEGTHLFASYLIRLRTNDLINPYYLTYYMNTAECQGRLKAFVTKGVSQANINATNLKKIKVPLPPKDEQEQIVQYLRNIDQKIESRDAQSERIQRLQTGVRRSLISGETRLHEDEIKISEGVRING